MNEAMRTGKRHYRMDPDHAPVLIPKDLFRDDEPCEVPNCIGVASHHVQHTCCATAYNLCPVHVDHLRLAFDSRESRQFMCENCLASPVPLPSITPSWML